MHRNIYLVCFFLIALLQTRDSIAETPTSSATTLTPSTTLTTITPSSSSLSISRFIIEKDFDFVVKDEIGKPCLASKMNINLSIRYNISEGSATHQLTVPKTSQVQGGCSTNDSVMILTWTEAQTKSLNTVMLSFLKQNDRISIDQIHADIFLDKKNFPDATEESVIVRSKNNLGLFSTSTSNSIYKCDIETQVNSGEIIFAFTDVSLRISDDISSELSEESCEAGGIPDGIIIGIIGGGLLILCIVIVVWKRRVLFHKSTV